MKNTFFFTSHPKKIKYAKQRDNFPKTINEGRLKLNSQVGKS